MLETVASVGRWIWCILYSLRPHPSISRYTSVLLMALGAADLNRSTLQSLALHCLDQRWVKPQISWFFYFVPAAITLHWRTQAESSMCQYITGSHCHLGPEMTVIDQTILGKHCVNSSNFEWCLCDEWKQTLACKNLLHVTPTCVVIQPCFLHHYSFPPSSDREEDPWRFVAECDQELTP